VSERASERAEHCAFGALTARRGAAAVARRYRKQPPDFALLASTRPGLRQHLVGDGPRATLNWKEPAACIELTKVRAPAPPPAEARAPPVGAALQRERQGPESWVPRCAVAAQALLEADFGLSWDLPLDRLCPTIPQKLNYIHWVEDLVALTPHAARGGAAVRGVDIGTGASCIYPLLGTAMHPDWSFVATEVDPRSQASATANVARNGLQVRYCVPWASKVVPAAAPVQLPQRCPWLARVFCVLPARSPTCSRVLTCGPATQRLRRCCAVRGCSRATALLSLAPQMEGNNVSTSACATRPSSRP
jgi:hypothetical protein